MSKPVSIPGTSGKIEIDHRSNQNETDVTIYGKRGIQAFFPGEREDVELWINAFSAPIGSGMYAIRIRDTVAEITRCGNGVVVVCYLTCSPYIQVKASFDLNQASQVVKALSKK